MAKFYGPIDKQNNLNCDIFQKIPLFIKSDQNLQHIPYLG